MGNTGRKYVSAIFESFEVSATLTKSTDVTNYSANDIIAQSTVAANSSALTFANVGTHPGQTVIINEVSVVDNYYSTTVLPYVNVWISKAKPTGIADNTPLSLTDAESLNVAAVIPTTVVYHASTNNTRFEACNLDRHITLGDTSLDLYANLEILTTYTPQISEQFTVILKGYRM